MVGNLSFQETNRISLILHNWDIIVKDIPVNALVEAIDIVPTLVDFVGRALCAKIVESGTFDLHAEPLGIQGN